MKICLKLLKVSMLLTCTGFIAKQIFSGVRHPFALNLQNFDVCGIVGNNNVMGNEKFVVFAKYNDDTLSFFYFLYRRRA